MKMEIEMNERDSERVLLGLQVLRCISKFTKIEGLTNQQATTTYNKVRRQFIKKRKFREGENR